MFREFMTRSVLAAAVGLWFASEVFAQTLPQGYWPAPPKQSEQRRVLSSATSIDHIHRARSKFREGAFQEAKELLASRDAVIRTDVRLDEREIHIAQALMSLFAGEFREALTFAEQVQSRSVPECPVCGFAESTARRPSPDALDIDAALIKAVVFAEVKMEGLTTAWAKWVKQQSPQVPLAHHLLRALEEKQLKFGHMAVAAGLVPGSHVDLFFARNPDATIPVQLVFSQRGKYAGTMSLVRYQRGPTIPHEYRLAFVDLQGGPLTVREFGRRGPSLPILQALAANRYYALDDTSPSSLRAELETYVADKKGVAPLVSLWLAQTRSPLAWDIHRKLVDQQLADWELTCMKNVGEIVHPVDGPMKIYWIVGFRNLSVELADLERLDTGDSSAELYHFAIFGNEPRGYVASYVVKAVALEPGVWTYALVRQAGGGSDHVLLYDRPPQNELPAEARGEEQHYVNTTLHDQAVADVQRLIDEELADLK